MISKIILNGLKAGLYANMLVNLSYRRPCSSQKKAFRKQNSGGKRPSQQDLRRCHLAGSSSIGLNYLHIGATYLTQDK